MEDNFEEILSQIEEIQEETYTDTSDTLGDDLPVEEDNSQDIILQEINNILSSQENIDYTEYFLKNEQNIELLIAYNEKMTEHQLHIGNDVATMLNVMHFFGIYLIGRLFCKLFYDLIFRGI